MLNTSVNLNETGDDYLSYRHHTELPPTPPANISGFERGESKPPTPRAQGSSGKGESYLGDQHSTTEQDHDLGLSDREGLGFLDSGEGSQPREAAFEVHSWFSNAQATPVFSDEFAVRCADPLLSLPAGIVGSRGTTRMPAELSPMDVRNPGIKRAGRRKQSTSPDCRREGERAGRKKQRHYGAREQTHVSPAGIGLTQMRL